jgi:uncharacterized protein YkuJ
MKTQIIFSLLLIILMSCGSDYEVKNNKVYYTGWNEGVGSYERLIEKADASTFEKISNEEDLVLGKDINFVFYEDSIIGTNPISFKRVGKYFFIDDNSVYFFGFVHGNRNKWSLDSVDVNTFKIYNEYPWAKDKIHLIYGDLYIVVNEIKKFKPINEYWGKTDNQLINEGHVFDSVDMKSLEIIDDYRAKDRNYRYEYGERIKY